MPPNRFESEVESFLEGSHGDRTHIKRADHPRLHHYAGRYSHAVRRSVLGEFCTGSGAVRLVQGESCTGSGPVRFLVGECCVASAPSESPVAGLPLPTGTAVWPSSPSYRMVARVLDRKICFG